MHLYYELPLLTPLLTPHTPSPIPGRVRRCLIAGIHGLGPRHRQHATMRGRRGDGARDLTMRGTRARKCHERLEGREQGNVARDMMMQGMQARQRREGGEDAREAIIVASSLSTRRAIIVILIVINICFF